MSDSLVFTFIAADKPGLVEHLARTVSRCGGNWLESRMSQLAGQFAGIVEVAVTVEQRAPLRSALLELAGIGLTIVIADDASKAAAAAQSQLRLHIIGSDRPGIVLEVAGALARRDINVLEMDTALTSAPMTAEPLFEAWAEIAVPPTLDLDDLQRHLDDIADTLTLDIVLEATAS